MLSRVLILFRGTDTCRWRVSNALLAESPDRTEANLTTTDLDTPAPKTHSSYSSLTAYTHCGKSYQLSRVLHLPEAPGLARLGGSAVHAATEFLDRQAFASA